jgi:hypothetical protein
MTFHHFLRSIENPLFKHISGHPWKSMEEALASQGFESPYLHIVGNQGVATIKRGSNNKTNSLSN